jgi:Leucine-rich repeat (LRR) protein
MKKHLSLAYLLFGLLLLVAFSGPNAHAQSDHCPRIYREGETIRTDSAQSYQWYRNGEPIPGATQQTYTPTGASANYAVEVAGKASTPFAYELTQVTLIGQAFDEHLRPVANARITVGNQTTQSDTAGRFQFAGLENTPTILLRGEKAGHWTSQRRIMPNGRETHVQLMLRSQPFEHELSAERGGTISRGPFFLTLQPNGVLDANNQRYTGVVKIALNGGRPDDPNFGWMMPGGDFMAQDAQGRERILYSYGFLSAHLQTPDGQPLKLDPNIGAQLRFVMPHTMVSSAPDSLPLWHFDEAASIWKEEGLARREGAAYIGTVRHFSSWNCDWAGPWCQLRGKTVDCKGRPISSSPLRLGQQIITSDSAGNYSGRVPATLLFDIQSMNGVSKITVGPFEEGSENEVHDLTDGSSLYGFAVIDKGSILNVQGYGTIGQVQYSNNNGMTYQTNNTFPTHMDSSYQVLVNDSLDCPSRVNYIRIGERAACQDQDTSYLSSLAYQFWSIEEALASNSPVYGLRIASALHFGFPEIIPSFFPCLQVLDFFGNNFNELSESIGNLSHLKILKIFDCNVISLPESIGNITQLIRLDLEGNKLTSLPKSIGNFSQLTTLNLKMNEITNLPESIGNLSQLKYLDLSNNQLSSLPESFTNLTELVKLDLSFNALSSLPESIGNLSQLQEIDLESNPITSLPESFGNLTQLKSLLLYNNQLTYLPESIGNLTQLESFHSMNNPLTRVPDSFWNLTQLESAGFDGSNLTSLPESIGNLTRLTGFYISSPHLSSLPESIGNLTLLKRFSSFSSQLSSLPESIGNLTQMESFELLNSKLTSLPESFGNMSRLTNLRLHTNQLTSLPESFGSLSNLTDIMLSKNQLTTLPESFGNLTNLKMLSIDNNQLTILPESFGNLTQLRDLYLKNNQLRKLPESFGNLAQLTTLNLDDNQLTKLPESFGNLAFLRDLNLNNNQLTSLPDSIGNFNYLQIIEVKNNQLTTIPESISKLTNLNRINLTGNPIPPAEIERIRRLLPNRHVIFD